MQVRYSQDGVKILFRLGLVVPLLIWAVPLLIWWVGGKMNSRIRLTSAKVGVGVEVEAELGNTGCSSSNCSNINGNTK